MLNQVVVVVSALIASSIAMPQGGNCPNGDPWNADANTVDANVGIQNFTFVFYPY
jgi:hypothetical protein